MRAWTLGFSTVVHLGFIAGVVVAPLLATDDLPVPPGVTELLPVIAVFPEPPAAPRTPQPRPPSPDAAPLHASDTIAPETPQDPEPIIDTRELAVVGGVEGLGGIARGDAARTDMLTPPSPPAPPAPPATPVRIGGIIRAPQKIRDVAPRYPAIAQASRLEGYVILDAVISEGGQVQEVHVLKSQPLLDAAAVDAVRQWRFTPTLLNGQPVPVVMTVTVVFKLQ
jgi:protein TonB